MPYYKIGKWTVAAIAVALYLVLGWHIGKTKYDIWFGLNGYVQLKNAELAQNRAEEIRRKLLFPVVHKNTAAATTAKTLKNQEGDRPFFLRRLQAGSAPIWYLALHSVLGPVFLLVWWFLVGLVIIDGLLSVFGIIALATTLLWNALLSAFLALL